ncbi:MAG: PAS-domain containing protein [Burkholderiaceae bacterium]|nr:PAS-domain containing protein [Burkholderiaceae bacterium]
MSARSLASRPWLVSASMGVVGALATAGAFWLLAQRIEADTQLAFDRVAAQVAADITRRFRTPVYGLNGLKGTYAASDRVTAQDFVAYVQARDLPHEFQGVRGFGLIERVQPVELNAWLDRARADHGHGVEIRTLNASPPSPRYLIRHIEPSAQNLGALGLDVGSEKNRRAALERAIDGGRPALTDPIVLVQDDRRTPGFLVCVPMYHAGHALDTPAQRRSALRGVLYAPIVAAELLADVDRVAAQGFAAFSLRGETDVFDSGVARTVHPGVAHHSSNLVIDVLDRRFVLDVHSTPAFEASVDRSPLWLATGGGAVITLLLVGLSMGSDRARWRAERRVADMTSELERLAAVARATGDGVLLLDPQRRIVWVNEAFTRVTGYTLEESLGREPGRLLQARSDAPGGTEGIARTLAEGHPFRGELCNRRKDGTDYWIDVEIQPLRDDKGNVTGWIAVESNITRRRETEQALATALRERDALLDTIRQHAIVSIADPAGRILEVNDAFCRLSGYTREELLGQDHRIVNAGHHPPAFWADMWAHLLAGWSWRAEICNRAKDGRLYWVDSIVAPFLGADGRVETYVSVRFEVTAAKQAALDLADQRERLATILAGTGAGTWEHDYAAGEDVVNEAYAQMLGDTPESFARDAGGFQARVHPDDLRRVQSAHDDHAAGRTEDYQCEFRMRHRAGHWIWVQSRGRLSHRDAQGKPLRMAGIHLDVTQRHAQEQALRQANEAMASIFENLPCAVSVFGPDLLLKASNRQFRSLLDFPDALFDLPAPSYEAFIRFNAERGEYGPGDPEETVRRAVRQASGSVESHHFDRTRPNGTIIEVHGGPMPGGGFVSTYTDVTEVRAAHVEAQRARNLLLGAIETIDEAFAIYDPQDRLVLCNERYRQVYAEVDDLILPGVPFETLVRAGAERGGFAEAVGRLDDWVEERMALHRRADADHLQPLVDGRTLRVLERRLPDGHIVGFRIDVTELVLARQHAEAASLAKSQFLATMSHEIRTPMNAIIGLLTLLRRTPLDARQADYATKTEGAARSLLALINDILDFSKVEAGKMELDPQPFRLASLLRDLQVLLEAARGNKTVHLRFEIDPSLPLALVGDGMRLQQVLLNLGGNALKFTEQGEVVVAVRVLASDALRARLRFSVRDTGIGIAPEHQARIFSGFTQAEASTTRRYGGTGLGVAISQRLVELMGGQLQLRSEPGQGSRFWFDVSLPLATAPALPDAPEGLTNAGAAVGQRLTGLRLLVAEDNATNQQVVRELLGDEGATVHIADNGEQALTALAAHPFDAVLMDLQMPVMDGLEATRRLRQQGLRLPVIGLTANALAQDRDACLAAGMDAHVGKPFDVTALVALLQRLTGWAPVAADPTLAPASPAAASPSVPSPPRPAPPVADAALLARAEAAGVRLATALERLNGRADVYREIYRDFVDAGLDAVHPQLTDAAEARRAVHSVKGLAATLGIGAVASAAETAETCLAAVLEAGATQAPGDALTPLLAAIATVRPRLCALADALDEAWSPPTHEVPAAGALPSDATQLAADLERLQRCLAAADMQAVDLVGPLVARHAAALGDHGQRLQRAVHDLDFDGAQALLQAVRGPRP